MQINIFIRESNDNRGLVTPLVAAIDAEGYRIQYHKLTDGCHPSIEIKNIAELE